MDPFISLEDAAWQLAGGKATDQAIEDWIALLASYADELHAVKSAPTHRDKVPGGISFIGGDSEKRHWRITRAAFNTWRETHKPAQVERPAETPAERRKRIQALVNTQYAQGTSKTKSFKQLAVLEGCKIDNIKRIYYEKEKGR